MLDEIEVVDESELGLLQTVFHASLAPVDGVQPVEGYAKSVDIFGVADTPLAGVIFRLRFGTRINIKVGKKNFKSSVFTYTN